MIDGITINYELANFEDWKRSTRITFSTDVDIDNYVIITKKRKEKIITTYKATQGTFFVIIKQVLNLITLKTSFFLTLKGSLHKDYYGGKNFDPFTWSQLQEQINHLCKTLCIDPTQAQISTLEIGVNIIPHFEVMTFLRQNIISYKGNSFNNYKPDKAGISLGIYCTLSQYEVKIYDKGLQNNLPHRLMRFEKRFLKMQVLNKNGIKYLTDLLNFEKVKKLLPHLLEAWQNVLIYDIDNLENHIIKQNDRDLLTTGQNPKFWERLKKDDKRKFNYLRVKYKMLVAKHGNNSQTIVRELIQKEWELLFKNCTNLPSGKKGKLYEFTIKVKGKNVQKRFCLSCGRDISNQNSRSRFCSRKYVGEAAAHHCRNKNSNTRNNRKRKIEKINGRGVLFNIEPFIIEKKRQIKAGNLEMKETSEL